MVTYWQRGLSPSARHFTSKPRQRRTSQALKKNIICPYDDLPQKTPKRCDSLRLYRVKDIYYYRRNINVKRSAELVSL